MAWLWVKAENGEDIALFEITDDAAYLELERVAPGLGNAVTHALAIDERERAKRAEYEARHGGR